MDTNREPAPIFPPDWPQYTPRFAPYQQFPVDSLPDCVREFVVARAAAQGCDEAVVALPVLAALASAIGSTRRIRLKRTWTEPAVLWTAIVADRGTPRRPALEAAIEPLRTLEEDRQRQQPLAMPGYEQALVKFRRAKRNYYGSGPVPRPPAPPCVRRQVVHDGNVQTVTQLLALQPRGLLVCCEELDGWLNRTHTSAALAQWSELHAGRSLFVDRPQTNRPVHRPHASASVTGTLLPETLARHLRKTRAPHGLHSRLLFAAPPVRPRQWTDDDDDVAGDDFAAVVEHLLTLTFDRVVWQRPAQQGQAPAKPDQPEPEQSSAEPVLVELSPEARRRFAQFVNEFGRVQIDTDPDLADSFVQLEAYAARLALVLHLTRWASGDDVDPAVCDITSLEQWITLARWFAYEALRVHAQFCESADEAEEHRLLDWLMRRGGAATSRDLCRSNGRRYPTSEAADAALERLAKDGVGVWIELPAGKFGGRPYRVLSMSPAATQAWTAEREDVSDTAEPVGPADVDQEEWMREEPGADGLCRTEQRKSSVDPESRAASGLGQAEEPGEYEQEAVSRAVWQDQRPAPSNGVVSDTAG